MKGDKKRKAIGWVWDDGCIRCTSHFHDREGYPFLTRRGRRLKMARHVMLRKFGEQPTLVVTRHTCDNSWCINPDHITIGSHADNYRDKIERGRVPHGQLHWNSRLTDEQTDQIRFAEGTHQSIADRFGISRTHVTNIKSGHRWAKETMRTLE